MTMITPFKLEHHLEKYEFSLPYPMCCSDAESMPMQDVLLMADEADKARWQNLDLSYTTDKGCPDLRSVIAEVLYPGLKADNILCFSGAEEGIFCALSVLCAPKDHVIVLGPSYQSLAEIPRYVGAAVSEVLLREENHWRISLEDITGALKPNTKVIVMNFPHNPTGQVIRQQELDMLVNLCRERGLWLFSDEVYRLLGAPTEGWSNPAANCYEKALSLGVMSKSFGMPGLRIGWIACQDTEILDEIRSFKHYTSICNSAPSEVLSLIALKNKDKILARNNKIVAANLLLLDGFFNTYQNLFSWVRPEGGGVGFVRYHGTEGVDIFCHNLVEKHGILLLPGTVYTTPSDHFRVGFCHTRMALALEKLENSLKK